MSKVLYEQLGGEVVAVLTDGDEVLDVRGIAVEELGQLNEMAQDVTEGELWWEVLEVGSENDISAQDSA